MNIMNTVIEYLPTLLSPPVAILTTAIAYWQWRIARNKLKPDFFEQRFTAHKAAQKLLTLAQELKRCIRVLLVPAALLMAAPAQADCGYYPGAHIDARGFYVGPDGAGGQLICDTATGEWRDNDVNLPINEGQQYNLWSLPKEKFQESIEGMPLQDQKALSLERQYREGQKGLGEYPYQGGNPSYNTTQPQTGCTANINGVESFVTPCPY